MQKMNFCLNCDSYANTGGMLCIVTKVKKKTRTNYNIIPFAIKTMHQRNDNIHIQLIPRITEIIRIRYVKQCYNSITQNEKSHEFELFKGKSFTATYV